jgi:Xaa-Pro aminopeptidase
MPEYFPAEEFAARRARVFDAIGPAQALLQGVGPVRGFEYPRQTNEFYYLTGLSTPQAYLWLDGARRAATVFLPHRDPRGDDDGPTADEPEQVQAVTGVEEVRPLEELAASVASAQTLYLTHAPSEGKWECRDVVTHWAKRVAADPWDGQPSREAHFQGLVRVRCPQAQICDLTPILDDLRLRKSPREVAVMRETGRLAALAVAEAMRATRPGMSEYHLWAIADHLFRSHGARGEGYRPIIAAGDNIWHIHYYRCDSALQDGDWVLMDYAPDICNYTNDIGRMWPVNGVYSPVQRELYGFMVRYHQALLARIRPGVLPQQILDEAAAQMRPVVEEAAWSKPIYQQAARRTLDFKGHLSHPVGMAVHDVGEYFSRPLEPGLVFSVDPQMWVPEEKRYVRVEDTVAVTDSGVEVLTAAAPLELDAVEAWLRETAQPAWSDGTDRAGISPL